ncbi:exopolyphosphatase/guanosine-5'-triphosphate,3'-diphosphate pyrophosphatase [Pseudochelatococcus contaminans]|uniref:Exopolyphosphatase/guanosine-5'-triphosphate, 3'-diphosphate pyrophosphatase n=2 Tax=Pseudochelatococcus contaminans TaxID=1538103 RepID=A0A7W5Z5E7_9HYPH|nr:exopolyphosphatase/guanosine-5'-triphosphate,3'-diphosphate pyrophosphatase [Pseudochelatococcus contaminans]
MTVDDEAVRSYSATTAELADDCQKRGVVAVVDKHVPGARSPGQQKTHAQRRGMRGARAYAALDLGTNNCRLLVAEPTRDSFRVVDAFSRIVRLGEGLTSYNRLGDDAIARAIEALKVCRAKMDARRVGRARLIATEACRAAINGQDFVQRVASETGLSLEIVDRKTEALLAVAGCAGLADPSAESVIVFDIGGGSTELVWTTARRRGGQQQNRPTNAAAGTKAGQDHRVRAWESLPLGVVTLSERFGGVEVTPDIFAAMVEEVRTGLEPFARKARHATRLPGFHLLGTSGTVTTVAGVYLDLPRYDRRQVDGLWMDDKDVSNVIDFLAACSYAQRVENPCIGVDRADLVLAGCAILEAIRLTFPTPRLRVADRGLREGILLNLMREDNVWNRRPWS